MRDALRYPFAWRRALCSLCGKYLMVKGTMVAVAAPHAEGAVPAASGPVPSAVVHRRHPRRRAPDVLARVRLGDGAFVAKVDDISLGGLFASTSRTIPIGAYVELTLLSPGHADVPVSGVIVDDVDKRRGLALRFLALSHDAARFVRRVIELEGRDGLAPTRSMDAPDEPRERDIALDELRATVKALREENERLKRDAQAGADAEKLLGRLRVENESLRARADGGVAVDVEVVADLRRDAEVAWMAIARISDALEKVR